MRLVLLLSRVHPRRSTYAVADFSAILVAGELFTAYADWLSAQDTVIANAANVRSPAAFI
jgi:hypothetical protein